MHPRQRLTGKWTPAVVVWMLVFAPALALAADQAGGLFLADVGETERGPSTAPRTPDRSDKDRSSPEASPPKRRGRFAASIQEMRPPVLPGPFGAVPLPPAAALPPASLIAPPAPAGAWSQLGVLGRSAPPADGVVVRSPLLVRRVSLPLDGGQGIAAEVISVRVIQAAAGADSPRPQAESLAPPNGGRQVSDPPAMIHHVSPLAGLSSLDPGLFDPGQAFLRSLGELPPEPGQATVKFRGVHRLIYKAVRSRYRRALRGQFRDDFLRDSGGDLFLRQLDQLERSSRMMHDQLHETTFPSDFSEALILNGQPVQRRSHRVIEVGSEVNLLTLGPVRLRNDLRIRLDSLDVDLFGYFRDDNPVADWRADIDDGTAGLFADDDATFQAPSAEGPLALGPARRELIPRGNLYTGDSVSVDGRVRLRLRLRRDVMEALAGSPSGDITTVFYGGPDHRPLARLVLSARAQGVDSATISLTLALYKF